MLNHQDNNVIQFQNKDEQKMAFEQYKILVESVNKLHETRENANNFWIGANGLGASALAYLRDTHSIGHPHKHFLLWTLVVLGTFLCLSWLNYLKTIKSSIVVRGNILANLEKRFPIPVFSQVFSLSSEAGLKGTLTHREMVVPYLFLAGYLFFAVLLFFFMDEVINSV